jgi:NhaP-type Na+/H+ or K+/H+ antiporter
MASSSAISTFDSTEGISAYFVLFSTLLALLLVLSKLLHDHPALNSIVPEAGMILLVGMVAGCFLNLFVAPTQTDQDDDVYNESVAESLLSFSPNVFFVALLPPIIFNSGYHLRRELFFRHIIPISLFAVVGTVVSAVSISFLLEIVKGLGLTGDFAPSTFLKSASVVPLRSRLIHTMYSILSINLLFLAFSAFTELLTFGALISATDPVSTLAVFQAKRVDPQLFYLVFGESVLNDAVGLVLFDAFSKFVVKDNGAGKVAIGVGEFIFGFLYDSIGSPLLGVFCGCGAALLFKHVDMRNNRLLELSIYVLIMYVPFLLADVIYLSGIVTILFTGMTARAYVVPNLSEVTADNAETLFRLFANLAETSIFLELGLSVFGLRGSLNGRFILWALLACLVGRALNVYPITVLYNLRLQTEPKSESELAAEQRHKQNDHYIQANNNDSHVEMTDDPPVPDRQHRDDQTPVLMIRQSSSETTFSNHTLTPRVRRDLKISSKTAHMLCFSGLRGAVAYACVRSFPNTFGHQTQFVGTTMVIILVTVFFLGSTTGTMLNWLEIAMNVDEERYMDNWHQERRSASLLLQLNDIIQRNFVRQESSALPQVSPRAGSPRHAISPIESPPSMDYSNVEVTEERHFENMDEMGGSPRRRETSLFDFGFKD